MLRLPERVDVRRSAVIVGPRRPALASLCARQRPQSASRRYSCRAYATQEWTFIEPHVAEAIWGLPVLASKCASAPNDRQPPRCRRYAHPDLVHPSDELVASVLPRWLPPQCLGDAPEVSAAGVLCLSRRDCPCQRPVRGDVRTVQAGRAAGCVALGRRVAALEARLAPEPRIGTTSRSCMFWLRCRKDCRSRPRGCGDVGRRIRCWRTRCWRVTSITRGVRGLAQATHRARRGRPCVRRMGRTVRGSSHRCGESESDHHTCAPVQTVRLWRLKHFDVMTANDLWRPRRGVPSFSPGTPRRQCEALSGGVFPLPEAAAPLL